MCEIGILKHLYTRFCTLCTQTVSLTLNQLIKKKNLLLEKSGFSGVSNKTKVTTKVQMQTKIANKQMHLSINGVILLF